MTIYQIDAGWLCGVCRCVSPNFNMRPDPMDTSLLVIHNISLPPGQFGGGHVQQLFSNCLPAAGHACFAQLQNTEVSAHVLIERDGAVTQFVAFSDRAWHAGVSQFQGRENCNDYSIGIELEGTDRWPYTDRQYERLLAVTATLMQHYPAITPERIVGHETIAPQRKTDPGSAFDWPYYRRQLTKLTGRP